MIHPSVLFSTHPAQMGRGVSDARLGIKSRQKCIALYRSLPWQWMDSTTAATMMSTTNYIFKLYIIFNVFSGCVFLFICIHIFSHLLSFLSPSAPGALSPFFSFSSFALSISSAFLALSSCFYFFSASASFSFLRISASISLLCILLLIKS